MKSLGFLAPYFVPLIWGISAYFGGMLAQKTNGLFEGHLWATLGFIFWSAIILASTNLQAISQWQWHGTGMAFGLAYSLGGLAFVIALNLGGSATKVVALSALYPAVTALLLFFLQGEALSSRKILGIVLAVVVGWLMA